MREDLRELLQRRVVFRFAVSLGAFQARVVELAANATEPVLEIARRLQLDDLYLATACAAGDDDAWRECGERHFEFMKRFARRVLRPMEADDVADRVIAELWQRERLATFRGRSSLRTWLATLVTNAAINALGARPRSVALDSPEFRQWCTREAARPSPEADAAALALAGRFSGILSGMQGEDKLLLLLYYEQGQTLDEIAAVQGGSKAGLSRKLRQLRETIKREIESRARTRLGAPVEALRSGVDLARIDFDLKTVLSQRGNRDLEEDSDPTV